jgi:predicted NAD/FAD-binding protein
MEDGHTEHFDHVVLATQANQARRLLADARPDEAAMLGGFHYEPVQVVTHTDTALLPARRRDWSPVNLWVSREQGLAESTIWVNAVQPALRSSAPVFQTVHPLRPVPEELVLGCAQFERPLVDARSQQALAQLQRLQAQADRRVWFCGAYAQAGIPLLESAVCSAFEVAALLGADLPGASVAGSQGAQTRVASAGSAGLSRCAAGSGLVAPADQA